MKWYAVQTQPNKEKIALFHLNRQGFDAWLPRVERVIKHARQVKHVHRPLFPGYLFAEVSKSSPEVKILNYTRGVKKIISFTDKYHPLEKSLVENLRLHCDANDVFFHEFSFKLGDRVKIEHGPFASFFGKVISAKSSLRVQVLLEFLNFNARTDISTSNISLISQ